ncbi:hypothetical protein [Flagellimonas sediminis]|uniref:Collagen-like protein n=1 Tax=Flagellimonas sediminis TaxID=2696468 RepID=A0A6I5L0Q4_9FLAO|nr:hypothetical protein [Allomuricauda sediminis]NDV43331.1 hypothetical protein [Allomuricauda sediminis]
MKAMKLFGMVALIVGMTLISCSGDDGKDGMDGIDGVNGTNGQDGTDGTNGIGFDELTRYGSVTLELNGNRPDGITIDYSTIFKFTQTNGETYSSNILHQDKDVFLQFTRFYSSPDDYYNGNFIHFYIQISNFGETTQAINYSEVQIQGHPVIGTDNKYFILDDLYESNTNGTSEIEYTDFNFDPDDNHLTFNYSFFVDASANDSTHPLHVKGSGDVYLLEEIQ